MFWQSERLKFARLTSIGLLILIGACSAGETFSHATVKGENLNVPRNSFEIVSSIKKIVEHGDLSNYSIIEKYMGVVVQEFPETKSPFTYEVCGFINPPIPAISVRQSIYSESPWFVDQKKSGKAPCSFTIVKEIGQGKIARLMGRIDFDTSKVCIEKNDVIKGFPSATGNDELKFRSFVLTYVGDHNIKLTFLSGTGEVAKNCVAELLFSQNFE